MTFVVKEGEAHLRKVEIAHNNGIAAEVHFGLSEGDTVIIHPPATVKDAAAISINL